MSYDVELRDKDGLCIELELPHNLRGGTYAVGGTHHASLNVTYNYGPTFRRVLGPGGLRRIYGMTAAASIPILTAAVLQLGTMRETDYWKETDGNVGAALSDLLTLAVASPPDAIWAGD